MSEAMRNNQTLKKISEILVVILGNAIMALGIGAFIVPADLMMGGATGMGMIVHHYFGIPLSLFVGIYNGVMFIIGAIFLGRYFAFTTLLSSFLFPIFLRQIEVLITAPLTADPMLSLILGGLLTGAGIGLVIRAGSSTGGNDIPAILLNKKAGVPLSAAIYILDYAVLFLQIPYSNIEKILYSIILILLYTMVIDKISMLGKSRMQVRIISKEYKKISRIIQTKIDRGVTLYHIAGGHTGEESCEIMSVLSKRELNQLNNLVMEIDPTAFIMLSHVNEVKGRGFTMSKKAL